MIVASSQTLSGALRAHFWFDAISSTGASGDVNGDGQISIADVTALVNIILGKDDVQPYVYDHLAADVNADDSISIADVTALVNKILGKEITLQSVVTNIDGLEYGGTSQETLPVR